MNFSELFDGASLDPRWAGSAATLDDANDRVDLSGGALTSVSGTLDANNWLALDLTFSFTPTANYADWAILLPRNDTQPRAQIRLRSGGVSGDDRVSTTSVVEFVDAQYGSFTGTIGVDGQTDTWINGNIAVTVRVTRTVAGVWEIFVNGESKGSGNEPTDFATYYSDDTNIDGVIEFGQGPYYLNSVTLIAQNVDPQNVSDSPDILLAVGDTGTFAQSGHFNDADGDTLTYSVSPALPQGFTLNTTTGDITCDGSQVVTAPAIYTISATDGQGGSNATTDIVIGVCPTGITWTSKAVTALTGIYLVDDFAGLAVGDIAYAYFNSGDGEFDPANGALLSGATSGELYIWFHDISDPDLATALNSNPYIVPVPASATSVDVGQIPLTIQAGWNKTDLVDPVTTEGSVLEGYSGDAPVTGDDLEWRVTSTLDSGVTFDVLATGEFEVTEATPGDWVTDIVIERRVVQSDGTIGSTANFTADATPPVQSNNPATGQPTITGTAQVGSTLTADTSGIADTDGLGTLNIQWLLDGSPINGATNTTYVPVVGDVGSDVSVQVSFTDGEGNAEGPLTSSAVTIQAASVSNTPTSGLPVITGTAQVGQQLGVDTSALADVDGLGTFTYSWRLDGSEVGTAATYTPNATGSLVVRVSHTDGGGTVETVSSAAVTVQAAPVGIVENSGNAFPAALTVPANGTYDLKQHLVIPNGVTPLFTVASGQLGQGVSMTSLGVLSNTGEAASTSNVTLSVEEA